MHGGAIHGRLRDRLVVMRGLDRRHSAAVERVLNGKFKDLGDATDGEVSGLTCSVGQEPYANRTVKPATCFRSFGGQVMASDDDEVQSAVLNAGCLGRGCCEAVRQDELCVTAA